MSKPVWEESSKPRGSLPWGKIEAGEAVKWAMQTEGRDLEQEKPYKKFKLIEETGTQSLCYTVLNKGLGTLMTTTCHCWLRVTDMVDHRSNRILEGRVQYY